MFSFAQKEVAIGYTVTALVILAALVEVIVVA